MTQITPELLLKAYAFGVFPMAKSRDEQEVYWVQPKERGVIPLDQFHVPKSLRKILKRGAFEVRVDSAFDAVISGCAESGPNREDTWINEQIIELFSDLFEAGLAHSVETWVEDQLVGGLYGLAMGSVFFGESMFTRQDNASKVALCHLVAIMKNGGYRLLDTQFITDHLMQFGAVELPHKDYMQDLGDALSHLGRFGPPLPYSEIERLLFSQSSTQTS
ncbi:MAG: leucyl/phenylalanyl-tRNA--protein transferase [Alphaproteobacteria bacterium]|nr:leucyl/phenylalanyl-tRNA--protein transferase [Alphaproteobacteria bacterium]